MRGNTKKKYWYPQNKEKKDLINKVFSPADICIPRNVDMHLWSVIACDQYSSQKQYWDRLDEKIAEAPSALRLIFPEAYLGIKDIKEEAKKANETMRKYLDERIFEVLKDSCIYVERTLADGDVRKGLIGVLDLECYDYHEGAVTPIRATEKTIEDRLPPRVEVRKDAPIEMPHVVVFIDDPDYTVIEPLAKTCNDTDNKLYDFDLIGGGGHIKGWDATDKASQIQKAINRLSNQNVLINKYGKEIKSPVIFAVGDGNHSLATAKVCWENIKSTLSKEQKRTHPARFSLIELVNIHDPSIMFEPIHRVLFDTDAAGFISEAEKFFSAKSKDSNSAHTIKFVTSKEMKEFAVRGLSIGEVIGLADEFCQNYMASNGGKIDYIHDDKSAMEMAGRSSCTGIMLPKMQKSELFTSIMSSGTFPKKSFSIGHAIDKRFYLECRIIK
jgi:uncharacterized protein (DUF1015 family)